MIQKTKVFFIKNMNQVHYLFAGGGFLVIGAFVFFFYFFGNYHPTSKTPLEQTIQSVQHTSSQQTAWASLEKIKGEDTIRVVVHNPEQKNIQSVQITLAYNPEDIEVSDLRIPENAVLELVFPGKGFEIDAQKGAITITAGYAGKSTNIPESFAIATFVAKKKQESTSFFSFPKVENVDAQQITIIQDNQMVNIVDPKKLVNFGL